MAGSRGTLLLSLAEREYVEAGVEQNVRSDGRDRLAARQIELEVPARPKMRKWPRSSGSAVMCRGPMPTSVPMSTVRGRWDAESRLIPSPLSVRNTADVSCLPFQVGIVPQANGSCVLKCGGTRVLAGVKVELDIPEVQGRGLISCSVNCSMIASAMFEGRAGEDISAELSREQ